MVIATNDYLWQKKKKPQKMCNELYREVAKGERIEKNWRNF